MSEIYRKIRKLNLAHDKGLINDEQYALTLFKILAGVEEPMLAELREEIFAK